MVLRGLAFRVLTLGVVGIQVVLCCAHDGHHPVPVKPAEMYLPTRMPDRIILSFRGDPKTTQSVTWRTSVDVEHGFAEIALADAGPLFEGEAVRLESKMQLLKTDINEAKFHSVDFQNLIPGGKYAYRVGDGTNWSEWFHFMTATERNSKFSFIYFGDAQNNIRSMWSRVVREAYGDAPDAKFFLHAGDLVNTAVTDAEWGEWFGAGGWVNAMVPSVAVPGNHEYAKKENEKRTLTDHWSAQFSFPENGPETLKETCFAIQYQNMLLVALNSNEQIDVQTKWLEQMLRDNRLPWVVCTFHHPVFSTAKDRDNPVIRNAWKPLFDKYRVDLVLQGHDHTYGRTGLDVPNDENKAQEQVKSDLSQNGFQSQSGSQDNEGNSSAVKLASVESNVATGIQAFDRDNGTVYVVSVSGPKMYNIKAQPFMKRLAEDTQLYQIVTIDRDVLRFESRTAVGDLYDAFELHKVNGEVNRLVEIQPEIVERLRPRSWKPKSN